MTECLQKAAECVCTLSLFHPGPHACEVDGARWTGRYGSPSFKVVQYPEPKQGETDGI